MQTHVRNEGSVPFLEAEAVVRSLSVAMHGDSKMVLPLLKLKEFDQYTTTHSLNVAVLSMGLAESLGCSPRDVRAMGVAGLLHDIGKIRIPLDVLTKPGKLSDEERVIMNHHPVEGARIIMQSGKDLGTAAIVAYEHHIMLNGGGYPQAALQPGVHDGEPPRSRVRRVRRAQHDTPLPRRLAVGQDDELSRRARGIGVRSRSRRRIHSHVRDGEAQVRVLSDQPAGS